MANGNLTINVTVNGAEDIAKLTKEFEKLKALVGEGNVTVDSQEYRLVTDREPKAGDFAKITSTGDDDLTVGKYYEIHYIDDEGDFGITDDTGHSSYIMKSDGDYFEVYEKVTAHEPVSLRPTIGNVVKVIGRQSHHRAAIGDFVKIVEDLHDWQPYRCEFLNGDGAGWFRDSEVILATDEEVADAKEKQAEAKAEARWAKIGRKPNEFKKGDIVKASSFHKYKIAEVREVAPRGYADADKGITLVGGGWDYMSRVELITPVEQRFDFAEVSA